MTAGPTPGTVDIGGAIGYGWRKLQQNLGPMLVSGLIVIGISIAAGLLFSLLGDGRFALLLRQAGNFVVSAIITVGWVAMALRITRGERPEGTSVLQGGPYLGAYIVAAILFGLMHFAAGLLGYVPVIGALLAAVAQIWLSLAFGFWAWAVVDRNSDPAAALQYSFAITAGHRWRILLFYLALVLLNIVGLLLFIVGVVFTLGISLLAVAYVYRSLSGDPVIDTA